MKHYTRRRKSIKRRNKTYRRKTYRRHRMLKGG